MYKQYLFGYNCGVFIGVYIIFSDALEAVLLNGHQNNIVVDSLLSSNLIGSPSSQYEVVVVGDMLYDTEFAHQVLHWLQNLHKR